MALFCDVQVFSFLWLWKLLKFIRGLNSLKNSYQSVAETFLILKMGKLQWNWHTLLEILSWYIVLWFKCKKHNVKQFMHCNLLILLSWMEDEKSPKTCALIRISILRTGILAVASLLEVRLDICSTSRGYSASKVLILYRSANTLEPIYRNALYL